MSHPLVPSCSVLKVVQVIKEYKRNMYFFLSLSTHHLFMIYVTFCSPFLSKDFFCYPFIILTLTTYPRICSLRSYFFNFCLFITSSPVFIKSQAFSVRVSATVLLISESPRPHLCSKLALFNMS